MTDPDELSAEDQHEGFLIRREIDRELISAIRRISHLEGEVSRLTLAVFGFTGDNGLMGAIRDLTEAIDRLDDKLSERTGQIHDKIDSRLTRVYMALSSAALAFAGAAGALLLTQ